VIEVASVRPGPIQGEWCIPYLRRPQQRRGRSLIRSKDVEAVLKRTLGCADLQEAGWMQLAIVGRRFSRRRRPTPCAVPWRRGNARAN